MGHTGENEQALRKIIDFTRMASIIILAVHFYYTCHEVLRSWKLTIGFVDGIFTSLVRTGLFDSIYIPKGISLCLLFVSLIGVKGKKCDEASLAACATLVILGLTMFLLGQHVFTIKLRAEKGVIAYFLVTITGYILVLTGGSRLSRYLKLGLIRDIFNKDNETFPQEERYLDNEYSINLPARYTLRGRARKSWINIVNPFRSLLVIGTLGAGNPYFPRFHKTR